MNIQANGKVSMFVLVLFSLFLYGCNSKNDQPPKNSLKSQAPESTKTSPTPNITGKYCVTENKGSLFQCITFQNGFMEVQDFPGLAFKSTVTGNKIYVEDPQRGTISFTIIDGATIECELFGLAGVYKKGG